MDVEDGEIKDVSILQNQEHVQGGCMVPVNLLSENRVINPGLIAEQGLAILVETPNGNVLFDTGQTDATVKNAKELDIDLNLVHKIVLSHGHYDHTDGLEEVLKSIPLPVGCLTFSGTSPILINTSGSCLLTLINSGSSI